MHHEKRMKVPAGKLLVVKAESDYKKITRVFLEGDFFLYPEESLHFFEEALATCPVDDLQKTLENIQKRKHIELVGVTIPAIVELMQQIHKELK